MVTAQFSLASSPFTLRRRRATQRRWQRPAVSRQKGLGEPTQPARNHLVRHVDVPSSSSGSSGSSGSSSSGGGSIVVLVVIVRRVLVIVVFVVTRATTTKDVPTAEGVVQELLHVEEAGVPASELPSNDEFTDN